MIAREFNYIYFKQEYPIKYFQKTIFVSDCNPKDYTTISNVNYCPNFSVGVAQDERMKQKAESEIERVISENMIMLDYNFDDDFSIVTTGGIIIMDKLSEELKAIIKEKQQERRKKIDSCYTDPIYSELYGMNRFGNQDVIKKLLQLQKEILIGIKKVEDDVIYQSLLQLLLESVDPIIQSSDYQEKSKQFLKEYSN